MFGGRYVRSFPYNRSMRLLLAAAVFAGLLAFLAAVRPTYGQSVSRGKPAEPAKEPIHIVADMLTSDSEARVAEFSGNVRATQGGTVITSDRLKIFYAAEASGAPQPQGAVGESAVKKIIASGNVRISFDNKVAVTREAVYNSETKMLVLTGPDSKITSGSDSLSGEKITYNRADGGITVEGGPNKRVEAVFHTGGGGIR